MKTSTFTILKKNRKYFAAQLNSYKCKIVIDDNSKDLELGEHELTVNDISVKTKYGVDMKFELVSSVKEQKDSGITTLKHFRYNSTLVAECKNLGGKWDDETDTWVFPGFVEKEVEELDDIYNSDIQLCEITAKKDVKAHTEALEFLGYPIARAFGRDSGAKLNQEVSLIEGSVTSGGSAKNWLTVCREDTVLRFLCPKKVIETYCEDNDLNNWKITTTEF
jgi:hypothetical protein